ncbi:MAG: Glycoside hydrolase, 38 vacuolar alpha mannosidase [Trichoglossum hirsutum]|nr:MAG: Glycoside hydrolase, 38 vacuolar alpha mannosidase [Trichoglossum hirsutum]
MGGETQTKSASQYPKLSAGPVGQQIGDIYRGRLDQFTGAGQYEGNNLLSMMEDGRSWGDESVKLKVYSVPHHGRPSFKEATSKEKEYKYTKIGESFGPSWSTHWFHITLTVPPRFRKKEHLEFHWDAGNEGMVWSEDGEPLQGLTGGDRIEWIFPHSWRDGKEHIFYIEMACNKMFGNAPGDDGIQPPNPDNYFRLNRADIVAINLDARQLFVDFWIIKGRLTPQPFTDAAREFPGNSWRSHEALQIANAIIDAFVSGDLSSVRKGREIAKRYLGKDIDSEKVYQNDNEPLVYGIGHCHIDTCWLWPWAETKRKVARSWANQCDLLDRYPEHRFVASQAQQYKWLEQDYPSLFDRVKAKVKKGTFHPIGGSWVEHDTNMPSGESLVRQFIHGQRFFESHFGERCTTFWLPDTFGYSSQLPQICRLAGMSRFLTQKLSWNNINKFPHTTFNWVALDGSQVLCHMPPSETYTAEAHFGDVKRSVEQHKSMDQDATSLLVFGKGDGGGGPLFQHIEKLRRCRGLSDKIGLLPRVKMGESVDDFFARLEKKVESGTKFVTWYGELYFELHRGTYTTQSNNKRGNRKSEVLIHDVEFLATLASLSGDAKVEKSYRYPKSDIDDLWEMILLCQFHDCLPGSSIRMCYDDSDKVYAEVERRGEKLIKDALSALGFHDRESVGSSLWGINTLPWHREELMELPSTSPAAKNGAYSLVKGNQCTLVDGPNADAISKPPASNLTVTVKEVKKGVFHLQNSHYKVEVQNGCITSLVDLSINREVVASGARANQFVIFDDKPLYWQAWDVEVYHLETRKELQSGETKLVERGPHKVSVVTETRISESSWIKTTISLAASGSTGPSYVEVHSEVEWRETMKFLKVEFPVDVTNTEASYETQFGVVRRPTHYNTSWDMAKFEVCCHKWADLSEHGFGVAILNDSKYGFATVGNVMRLSLIRAPKAPDADADMGRHHIRYAILPHAHPLDSTVVRTAHNFNNPMRFCYRPSKSPHPSLLSSISLTGSPSLILDTVKRGEDDEDVSRGEFTKRKGRSVILRIYDSLGGKSRGVIKTSLPVKRVWKTNVLEDDLEEIKVENGEVEIELRAFEVATFRLQM